MNHHECADAACNEARLAIERSHLRCTSQRAALYAALRACKSHPTAEELFNLVSPQIEKLSLATVYNTLDAFCCAGLAKKLPTVDGRCRYDADTADHLHVRLAETDEISDVPRDLGNRLLASLPSDVLEEIEARMGIAIDRVSIQLTATRPCSRDNSGP